MINYILCVTGRFIQNPYEILGGTVMEKHTAESNDIFEFVEGTLMESFLKVAIVNVLTGEYKFLRHIEALIDESYENIPSMYLYIDKQVEDKIVVSEYIDDYLRFSDAEYVQSRVFSGEKNIIQSYKRITPNGFMWVTFGIVVPDGFSRENPWVIYTWREADTDTITMLDALSVLSATYYKILRINLKKDTFEIIRAETYERAFAEKLEKISDWWRGFAEAGYVHADDLDAYNAFTDIEALRERFAQNKSKAGCRYRRKNGDDFRWARMELVPSIEYTDENPILILYVKDIHEEYLAEQERHQRIVDNYNRDALTKLYNRHKFNEDINYVKKHELERLSCLYIDANGLHELNNSLGHQKGDDMLCAVADALKEYFPDERKYRIGGDEFVVLSKDLSKLSIEHIVSKIRSDLEKDNYEISVGIYCGEGDFDPNKVVGAAELAMRADKEWYYKHYNSKRRKREMNEELEKMIMEKQDADHFIEAISMKYAGVYLVDLNLDTPRDIYMPRYFNVLLKETEFNYSKALTLYCGRFVKEEYQAGLKAFLDYDNLRKRLAKGGVVEFKYQKIDDEWMSLRVMALDEPTEEKFDTIWIFARGKE